MRLAILMTNTDESAFAQTHPKDGQKFSELLWRVRPDWKFEVFSVKDGIFPKTLDFDGLLVTGSPASIHDDAEWIGHLESIVREAAGKKIPMFGACFGHQVIAKALGGDVIDNPNGWVLGRIETQFLPQRTSVTLYAAHKEQVVSLPNSARIVARTPGCEIAGFAIGDHVLTTQYHPEMTGPFIAALLDAFAEEIGHDVTSEAAKTLTQGTDIAALGEWIARFYERAVL
ncbi:type 1 glutamine amidotransferase [uncultured Sulfitobacter sp.]|uniref:type 1 glutamine amidotransferase n=1 Tax=uncultured Sulfitobacter sp. TaxID=191468 RepID=UPI002608A452|nr:type 1 glutamine amidotransferase [uncultured Sulfitobacter sp.]